MGARFEGMIGCWLRPMKHPTLRNRHRTWGFNLAQKRLGFLPWCRRGSRPPGCALAISERWLPQPEALRSSVYSTFATLGHRHEDSEASSPSTPDAVAR